MKPLFLLLALYAVIAGLPTEDPKPPFSIAIVPLKSNTEGGTIEMARKSPRDFYVVLTNVSEKDQFTWEYWNWWGNRTISFELTTAEGKKIDLSKKPQDYTMNYPSTFLVKPGEHEVIAVRLDEQWDVTPILAKKSEMPITLKVFYEVQPTEESAKYKVWIGRIESHDYKLALHQW
jgi:hypothetical protein